MPDRDDRLIGLAAAVSDGTAIDWDAAASTAATDSERAQIRRMRLVHEVAQGQGGSSMRLADQAAHDSLLHPTNGAAGHPSDEAVPVAWGPLRVIEKIGRGRFGDVYRAFDPRLDREVALKLLRRRDSGADALGPLVIEEGRLLAKVRHPNVVSVYGAERIDDRVGVWMELIHGCTLEEELVARGPMPGDEVAAVGADICRALSAVHRAGLVHRDIKAQNVMRDEDGRLVVMDFGTGRELEAASPPELAGTPLYLAPELLNGGVATPQSDLYSLGVLLHHLATGSFPITGRTLREIREAHARTLGAGTADALARQPQAFRDAIVRALSSDPNKRFSTAAEFEAALAEIKGGAQAILTGSSSAARPLWRWKSARVGAAVLIVGTLVTALGALYSHGRLPMLMFALRDSWLRVPLSAPSVQERVVWTGPTVPNWIRAVSPDGRYVAYEDEDNGQVVFHDVVNGTDQPIIATNYGLQSLAFSRDGKRFAYTWLDTGGQTSVARFVIRSTASAVSAPLFTRGYDENVWLDLYDWSLDGTRIAVQQEEYQVAMRIGYVDTTDGRLHLLKTLDWHGSSRVSLSPTGAFLAFDRRGNVDAIERDVFVLSTDGDREVPIAVGPGRDEVVGWSPDGRYLLFHSDRGGPMSVWAQPMTDGGPTGAPILVKASSSDEVLGFVGANAMYLTVPVTNRTIQTAAVDFTTGRLEAAPETTEQDAWADNLVPMFSPDGTFLLHVSKRARTSTERTLVIHSLTTGVTRELPTKLSQVWTYDWSADERTILARATDFNGHQGIYRIDAQTGAVAPVLLNSDQHSYFYPQWADMGTTFYYTLTDNGRPMGGRLVERNLESKKERVVSNRVDWHTAAGPLGPNGFRDYTMSPDKQWIACLEPRSEKKAAAVWVVHIADGLAREMLRLKPADWITANSLHWTSDGRGVVINRTDFSTGHDAKPALWFLPVEGSPVKLDIGVSNLAQERFAVSADNRHVAFIAGENLREVRVLEHFLPTNTNPRHGLVKDPAR